MRNRHAEFEKEENPFALSIGDLMAALLLIFVLLLAATLIKLQDEFKMKSQIAENYSATKEDIYRDLIVEFSKDLKSWNADLDSNNLAVRFKEPDILFEPNQYTLKPAFKEVLKQFFPRYIKVITSQKYKSSIEEIRIEGHTDSVGSYYHNMELSQNRTRSVLEFVLDSTNIESATKSWVKSFMTANGLSFSRPIADNRTNAGRNLNRRVEFRIKTNAEKQIEEILKFSAR